MQFLRMVFLALIAIISCGAETFHLDSGPLLVDQLRQRKLTKQTRTEMSTSITMNDELRCRLQKTTELPANRGRIRAASSPDMLVQHIAEEVLWLRTCTCRKPAAMPSTRSSGGSSLCSCPRTEVRTSTPDVREETRLRRCTATDRKSATASWAEKAVA